MVSHRHVFQPVERQKHYGKGCGRGELLTSSQPGNREKGKDPKNPSVRGLLPDLVSRVSGPLSWYFHHLPVVSPNTMISSMDYNHEWSELS